MTIPTPKAIEAATESLGDMVQWRNQCHAASLHVVRSGALGPEARVARGFHGLVSSQHSWVAVGYPYSTNVFIFDPTLWCHAGKLPVPMYGTWVELGMMHWPKGLGHYTRNGPIPAATEDPVDLGCELSVDAQRFLDRIGPLDWRGWHHIATMPVEGWPAAEIIGAMRKNPKLKGFPPIDVVGMLTDENPNELYR